MISPRERVRTALEHSETDRIPIGYWATKEADEKLKKYLSLKEDNSLLKRLGVDIREVFPKYIGPKEMHGDFWHLHPGKNIWGVESKPIKYANGVYYEIINFPLKSIESI